LPRLITYNVHRCLGLDGRLSPQRIAEVIAPFQPDIVALQELDVFRARSGGVDQAHAIASALGMQMHFHPALRVMEELYGDAILTPRPSRLVKAGALPGLAGQPKLEPRGALWAAIKIGGADVQVVNTHLGLRRGERLAQVNALLGPDWTGHPACRDPLILTGDFNAVPGSRAYRRLATRLCDAQRTPHVRRPLATFPVGLPFLRIDHVFVSRSIEVTRVETIRNPVTRQASDHLPLLVDFRIAPASERRIAAIPSRAAEPRRAGALLHSMRMRGESAW
jgi:endonuclease/exonuclease/phosphatase family metal-dependent hydrolase